MAHRGGCVLLRMIHRAGILLPDNAYYFFKGGSINGITWTGSYEGYSSYEINTHIRVRGYIWNGVSGTGSSSVITYVDLRGFKHLHFLYTTIKVVNGTCPNVRVYPNYVSTPSDGSGPWTTSYDLSTISDLSNVLLMIQSGHVSKTSTSGVIDSELVVTAVWATRD